MSPEFDGKEINEEEIVPRQLISLKLMFDIALGSHAEARFYYEKFKEEADKREKSK